MRKLARTMSEPSLRREYLAGSIKLFAVSNMCSIIKSLCSLIAMRSSTNCTSALETQHKLAIY